MDFQDAQRAVTRELTRLYSGRESPKVLPYGFDTGGSWAPMVDWDGVLGVYVYLVGKRSGTLKPVSLPEFLEMPEPRPVGAWP